MLEDEDEARPLTSKGTVSPRSSGPSVGAAAAPKAYIQPSSGLPAVHEPKSGAEVAYPSLLSVWRPVYDLASPVLLTYVLTFGIPIVTLIFVGHLGKDELAVRMVGSCWRKGAQLVFDRRALTCAPMAAHTCTPHAMRLVAVIAGDGVGVAVERSRAIGFDVCVVVKG